MTTHKHSITDHDHVDQMPHEHDNHGHDNHNEHTPKHDEITTHDNHDSHNHQDHDDHAVHGHAKSSDHHDSHGGHHGGDHGGHGGHGGHGHGGGHGDHGAGHGDHGGGSKLLGIISLGAILGLVVLLGIPTLFSKVDQILDKQTNVADSPGDGLLSSYTVSNARDLHAAKVVSVAQQMIDTPKASMPVIYITLANGERFMAMDMSAFKFQGISSAAIFMSKEAYQRAKNLIPGKANLRITGEPPVTLMLAGIAPLVIGIETK